MDIKEWLSNGRKLEGEVYQLREACRRAYELATLGSADRGGEKVQTSRQNTSENRFAAYVCYRERLEEEIEKLLKYRSKMMEVIERTKDCTYKSILIARYINCKSWEQIAEELNYNLRWVHRMHTRALEDVRG